METKKEIRKRYQGKRDAISKETVKELSLRISQHILQWDTYKEAKKVYFYYSLGKEVSLLPVIEDAMSCKKQVAFPKVTGNQMEFYEINSLNQLAEGCFHVMEPQMVNELSDSWNQSDVEEERYPKLADWEHAICFVPGVVFDQTGARFGYGKGYYDCYFSGRSGCRLVGCAYQCQVADELPADEWDVRMNDLVTENGIIQMKAYSGENNR